MIRRVSIAFGIIAALLLAPAASTASVATPHAALVKPANDHGCC